MFALILSFGIFIGFQAVVCSPIRRHAVAWQNNTTPFCGRSTQPALLTCTCTNVVRLRHWQAAADQTLDGDLDTGGPGVFLKDLDYVNTWQGHYYFFYENGRDDHPWKYTLVGYPDSTRLAALYRVINC